jgi:hypothetical protein
MDEAVWQVRDNPEVPVASEAHGAVGACAGMRDLAVEIPEVQPDVVEELFVVAARGLPAILVRLFRELHQKFIQILDAARLDWIH